MSSSYSVTVPTTSTVNPNDAMRRMITACILRGLHPVDLNSTKITRPRGRRNILSGSPFMNWDSSLTAIPPTCSTYFDAVRSKTFSLVSDVRMYLLLVHVTYHVTRRNVIAPTCLGLFPCKAVQPFNIFPKASGCVVRLNRVQVTARNRNDTRGAAPAF